MNLSDIPIFRQLSRRVEWLNQRQEVLSINVANADTPGFAPQDLKPVDFKRLLQRTVLPVRMAQTDAGHLTPSRQRGAEAATKVKDPYEVSPSGNAVVLEEQLIKTTETAMAHDLATNLYRRNVGLMKIALGTRGA